VTVLLSSEEEGT